jgi:hypothetical protein
LWSFHKLMRTNTALTVAAILAAVVSPVFAADTWEFDPRLELGYEYNDNYRLDFPGDEIDVSGGKLDAALPVRLVSQIQRIELAPRVRSTLYPDEREEDSTDYFLTGLFEHRGQRNNFGLDGEFSREDVVRSELPDSSEGGDLGAPSGGDSGRVLLRNRRDQLRFAPYWRYEASQRQRIEAGGYYLDVDYEKDASDYSPAEFRDVQQDFTDSGLYAGWGYLMSQRNSLTFRARASRYETVFNSDAYGAEVEWRSEYSQTSQVYLRLGGQQTELASGRGDSETSVIAGAGGRWTWPTTNAFADLTRTVGPTSAGVIVERSQLRLRLQRAVRPKLSLLAGARATRDEAVRESSNYPTRKYLTGEVGFDWRLNREWSVIGSYDYIWQEYADEPADRSSNAISLGIVYEPGRGE